MRLHPADRAEQACHVGAVAVGAGAVWGLYATFVVDLQTDVLSGLVSWVWIVTMIWAIAAGLRTRRKLKPDDRWLATRAIRLGLLSWVIPGLCVGLWALIIVS